MWMLEEKALTPPNIPCAGEIFNGRTIIFLRCGRENWTPFTSYISSLTSNPIFSARVRHIHFAGGWSSFFVKETVRVMTSKYESIGCTLFCKRTCGMLTPKRVLKVELSSSSKRTHTYRAIPIVVITIAVHDSSIVLFFCCGGHMIRQ